MMTSHDWPEMETRIANRQALIRSVLRLVRVSTTYTYYRYEIYRGPTVRAKPVTGRYLGYSEGDDNTEPYIRISIDDAKNMCLVIYMRLITRIEIAYVQTTMFDGEGA